MKVELRDVTEADLPVLFEHQADPVACTMANFESRDREAFFDHWRTNILAVPECRKMAVVVEGEVVGNAVAFTRDGRREVGYWIARERWGQGIATAALRLLLRLETGRPLHAFVAKPNLGSIRVLEKCGFAVEREEGPGELLMRLD